MALDFKAAPGIDEIARRHAAATGNWNGCDWPTVFGRARLNLQDVRAAQAILMARATAGKEAEAWWEASRWLARVEQEAQEAETEARAAAELARAGKWVEALAHARNACDIETRYHQCLVWQPLRETLELALKRSSR
jgi:hypothetical protein